MHTHKHTHTHTHTHTQSLIELLHQSWDVDDSGSMGYHEMRIGLQKLKFNQAHILRSQLALGHLLYKVMIC